MERGVIVGGVLICVSFLLAVFLNHSATEPPAATAVPAKLEAGPQSVAPTLLPAVDSGTPECRALAAARNADHEDSPLLDNERCPADKP